MSDAAVSEERQSSSGWVVRRDQLVNEFVFHGSSPGRTARIQILCTLQRGPNRGFLGLGGKGMLISMPAFMLSPGLGDREVQILAIFETAAGTIATGLMPVRVGPNSDGSTQVRPQKPDDARTIVAALMSGQDCRLRLLVTPDDAFLDLAFKMTAGFADHYGRLASRT